MSNLLVIDSDGGQVEGPSLEAMNMAGVGRSHQYMASNGPTEARRLKPRKVMTKNQLAEQKMNEAQGYPSNLDEAGKVKSLEKQMGQIQSMLQTLVGQSTPLPNQPQQQPIPVATPSSPAAATFGQLQAAPVPPSMPSQKRSVTLSNGKQVQIDPSKFANSAPTLPLDPMTNSRLIPPMGMGAVDAAVEPEADDLWGEEATTPVDEFVNDPKLEQVAIVTQQVREWLLRKDALRYFRRATEKTVSRHATFHGWTPAMQAQFVERFKVTLTDPVYLSNIVTKVLNMPMGYALSPEKIAEIAVQGAGWISFVLAGI